MSDMVSQGPSTPRKEEDLTLRIPTQRGCALAPQGHGLCLWSSRMHLSWPQIKTCWVNTERLGVSFKQRCFWSRANLGKQSRRTDASCRALLPLLAQSSAGRSPGMPPSEGW